MMPGDEILMRAERVRVLMQRRLGARGHTLTDAVVSRGARLPRKLRPAADALADAARLAPSPKLARQADLAALRQHETELLRYLNPLGRRGRVVASLRNFAAAVVLGLLVLGGLALWIMVRRGMI